MNVRLSAAAAHSARVRDAPIAAPSAQLGAVHASQLGPPARGAMPIRRKLLDQQLSPGSLRGNRDLVAEFVPGALGELCRHHCLQATQNARLEVSYTFVKQQVEAGNVPEISSRDDTIQRTFADDVRQHRCWPDIGGSRVCCRCRDKYLCRESDVG
jgi:hypothetical protein